MSNFVVSARKYRPSRFEDVVGQEHISQTLKNALRSDHVAHAFLFCGPRGVGKTTCARILAKILNCEQRSADYEACNECSSCRSFNENASFNIFELDAASNNGVEHIRALVDQVRFPPQHGKFKVYIIDEVHMLSQAAFNAFLKTLEEPPPHAIFILATTEKHKIIPTILSRCQIYDFRRIQPMDAVNHLRGICLKEGIEADEDALFSIGVKADGAMRDALSIFDRIISASGKKMNYQDVVDNLNLLDYDYYFKVIEAFLTENVAKIMLVFDDILKKGFDAEIFINGLSEHVRNLLVCKDEQTLQLLEVSDTQKERYRNQARTASTMFLLTALHLCNDCDIHYKMARNKRLHVEMALIKMTYIHRAVEINHSPVATEQEKKKPKLEAAPIVAPNAETTPQVVEPSVAYQANPKAASSDNQPVPSPSEIKKETSTSFLKNTSKFASGIPSLTSLEHLHKEVRKEEAIREELQSRLNDQNLHTAWHQYANNIDSPTTKATLEKAELRIESEDRVTVLVGSALARNSIIQLNELIDYLRKDLHTPSLMLDVAIDPTKAALIATINPAPARALTLKEKYAKMLETNPLLQDIIQRIGLKPDER
jgi:DNA polymerase III subunit gamma/tau